LDQLLLNLAAVLILLIDPLARHGCSTITPLIATIAAAFVLAPVESDAHLTEALRAMADYALACFGLPVSRRPTTEPSLAVRSSRRPAK
jgi:hypothetical protein